MVKTLKLEAISPRLKRVKLEGDAWVSYSPFLNSKDLKVGSIYEFEIKLDDGQWYIDAYNEVAQDAVR